MIIMDRNEGLQKYVGYHDIALYKEMIARRNDLQF